MQTEGVQGSGAGLLECIGFKGSQPNGLSLMVHSTQMTVA